jgi:hypothetical protein
MFLLLTQGVLDVGGSQVRLVNFSPLLFITLFSLWI